jgi:hypothetical protein
MPLALVQPRHVYAPDDGEVGHVYMPTALLSVAARLIKAGVEVDIFDENICPAKLSDQAIGINVIGPPYVARTVDLLRRHRREAPGYVQIVGGQGVRGFSNKQLSTLFGGNTVAGNQEDALSKALGLRGVPQVEATSLIPAYQRLPAQQLALYLKSEFCFYLSQGRRFSCTFCAAERSTSTRQSTSRVVESYRRLNVAYEDLLFLSLTARSLMIPSLNIYLSNLDLFQTPKKVDEFANITLAVAKNVPEVRLRMRALSTAHSFLMCHERHSRTITKLVDAGLERVGFGIDGATPLVWKRTRKPQNADRCIRAIILANEHYGLIPESLMVFGHNETDDQDSLEAAVRFVDETRLRYKAVPRPHVAKSVIPGNDGWNSEKAEPIVSYLLSTPEAFQLLDFTTLPSWLTHPDAAFRAQVSSAFLRICEFDSSLTQYTLPEDPRLPAHELTQAKLFNQRRYDI